MTTNELAMTLATGGTVTLTIDIDWLNVGVDDFTFVRDLAAQIVGYALDAEPRPVAAPFKAAPATPAPAPRPKPAPAVKAAAPKPAAAQTRTYDYAVVARVAIAAQKAGVPTARAVAQHLNVNENSARLLIAAARQKGHDIPKMSKGGRPPSNVTPLRPPTPPVTDGNHPSRFTPADAIGELEQNR